MNKLILLISLLSVALSSVSCTQVVADQSEESHWKENAVIYELNTRQFTAEGTFTAAEKELPRLKELGVDIIWLMPIQPIGVLERKGGMGSYYAIKDYVGVNSEYGTKEDLQKFIAKAHKLGIKVILDWVANHTSPDALWVENDGWHIRDKRGELAVMYDWTDITELDYDNKDMQRAMIDAMKYWVEEMDFDGFRCDMAMLVPTPFWESAHAELLEIKPDLFMLSEAEEVDLTENVFDMYYGWSIHHIMNSVAKGEADVNTLWANFNERNNRFKKSAIPMLFTSNHDENSHAGTEFDRMGDASEVLAAFTYVVPSMPLIYTGQELGNDKRLRFFDKDTININNPAHYTALYKNLNKLRKDNPALWSGESGGDMVRIANDHPTKVFSMSREVDGNRVVVVMNMSPDNLFVKLGEGYYKGEYTVFPSQERVKLERGETLDLKPWQYLIYHAKNI